MAYERHLRDVLALHKARNDLDVAATASTAGVVSANTGPFSRLRSAAGPAIRLQSEALPGGALGVELSGPHLHDLLAPEARQHRPPAPARRHAEWHRAPVPRVAGRRRPSSPPHANGDAEGAGGVRKAGLGLRAGRLPAVPHVSGRALAWRSVACAFVRCRRKSPWQQGSIGLTL